MTGAVIVLWWSWFRCWVHGETRWCDRPSEIGGAVLRGRDRARVASGARTAPSPSERVV